MGMFDYIKYEANCPSCGQPITERQSKSGPCGLTTLEPWQVSNFHAPCTKCHVWIEASVTAEVEHIVKSCDVKLSIDNELTRMMVNEYNVLSTKRVD